MKRLLLALFALLLGASSSFASCPAGTYYTSNGNNCIFASPTTPLPVYQGGSSYTNISTNANTVIKTSSGTVAGLVVNTAGATSTVTIFDNTTCTGTTIATISTVAQASIPINALALTGICVTTAGGTPANVTVLWR